MLNTTEAKAKISKLLALAKDKGATTNEAQVAINKAKQLADKYGVVIRFADGSIYGKSTSAQYDQPATAASEFNSKRATDYVEKWIPKDWHKATAETIIKLFAVRFFGNKSYKEFKGFKFWNPQSKSFVETMEYWYNMVLKEMRKQIKVMKSRGYCYDKSSTKNYIECYLHVVCCGYSNSETNMQMDYGKAYEIGKLIREVVYSI